MKTLFFIATMYILSPFNPAISGNTSNAEDVITQNSRKKDIADTASLNGQWFLQPMLASDTAAGKIPVLRINLSTRSFTGNTGCNKMNGRFQKTDTSLVFDPNIMTTKIACTGYNEVSFIKSLLSTNRFKIDKGVLVLMFGTTELSRWVRKPQRTLKMNKA